MGLEDFLDSQDKALTIKEENALSLKIIELENQIANAKDLQKELETKVNKFKEDLRSLMVSKGCVSWKTPNNFTFTVIEEKEPEEVVEIKFDEKKFQIEQAELYKAYTFEEKKLKNGRKGYLRITTPKEKK